MAVMYHSAKPARTASPPRIRRKEIVLLERVLQLGDEIVDALDADRQAHQSRVDAEVRPDILRERSMRHDRRVLDQAFYAAEAFGEREQLAALEEAARRGEAAFQHCGHHAAVAAVHLARGEEMLRMGGETRIDDALDLRM